MKYAVGIRFILKMLQDYGFEGCFYILIGLIVMALINAVISLIPAAVVKLCFDKGDDELTKGAFIISFIVLCIIEFILF